MDVSSRGDKMDDLWLTKSNDWSYEKEWRILVSKGGLNYNFDCEIKSIIFGIKLSDENREFIINIFKGTDVQFKAAKKHDSKFEIQIVNA